MGSSVSQPTAEQAAAIHVLIIGCGYGGLRVAAELTKAGLQFTLVEPKQFMHHCVAALRAAVDPAWAPRTAIPLEQAFGSRFVQGRVVTLDPAAGRAVLECGREVEFSHCVVAVGSTGPAPARSDLSTLAELQAACNQSSQAIADAKDIVVVGGGPVGVEMVGEIADKHKDKNLTLITANEKLVSQDFNEKFHKNINSLLDSMKVKVVVGKAEKLAELETLKVVQQEVVVGEQRIQADLVISCVGLPPNRSALSSLLRPDQLDELGRAKVNQFLQLEVEEKVFAIGDCCNTQEDKMAAFADKHGEVVATNIISQARGCPLTPYKRPFVGMLVPVGSKAGVGIFNGWSVPSFAGTKLKYADLFTSKFWDVAGVKMPQ